jgi:hypothetical protein
MNIDHIVGASSATEAFKRDVRAFTATGHAERIVVLPRAPRIKVLRVLAQLLSTEPELAVEAVRVSGVSGCADYTGTLEVEGAGGIRSFQFSWDCAWRAREERWTDCFGFPDQIRAASEFEWRCFRVWKEGREQEAESGKEEAGAVSA